MDGYLAARGLGTMHPHEADYADGEQVVSCVDERMLMGGRTYHKAITLRVTHRGAVYASEWRRPYRRGRLLVK